MAGITNQMLKNSPCLRRNKQLLGKIVGLQLTCKRAPQLYII